MAGTTPHQRLHVRCLLIELELGSRFVTAEMLPYAERAGISGWEVGNRIDALLETMTGEQARALAKALLAPEVASA